MLVKGGTGRDKSSEQYFFQNAKRGAWWHARRGELGHGSLTEGEKEDFRGVLRIGTKFKGIHWASDVMFNSLWRNPHIQQIKENWLLGYFNPGVDK